MICPVCGHETTGRNHNGRGLRCTNCWARLTIEAAPIGEARAVLRELGLDAGQIEQAMYLGLCTIQDVLDADNDLLQAIDGVGPVTASRLRDRAEAMSDGVHV